MKDYGYPNIAHIGELLPTINTLYRSNTFPVDSAGTACVLYDGVDYSNFNMIRKGEGVLNALSGTQEGWGDYTGIHKKYNQPCSIWSCGTFAKSYNSYASWVSEIRTQSADCSSSIGIDEKPSTFSEFKLYPNPSADLIDLKFVMEKQAMHPYASMILVEGKLNSCLMVT